MLVQPGVAARAGVWIPILDVGIPPVWSGYRTCETNNPGPFQGFQYDYFFFATARPPPGIQVLFGRAAPRHLPRMPSLAIFVWLYRWPCRPPRGGALQRNRPMNLEQAKALGKKEIHRSAAKLKFETRNVTWAGAQPR